MGGFVDLHNHMLPGLDDGAANLDEAESLLKRLHSLGFIEIHPTPHQKARSWSPDLEAREEARRALRERIHEESYTVNIGRPGGENMWDDLFLSRQTDRTFPLYEGDKAFLLEFVPGAIPPKLAEHLFAFRMSGLLPVIAHVERFPELVNETDDDESLRGKAALTINLSSLGGLAGWTQRRLARKLVLSHRVHAIATDTHHEADLSYALRGLRWLEKRLAPMDIDRLLEQNPRQILQGEIPD